MSVPTADPKAAIFDLDGTLILSEHRNRAVWAAFFAQRGLPLDDDLAGGLAGRRGVDTLADLAHLFPGQTPEELVEEVVRVEATTADLPEITAAPGAAEYVTRLVRTGIALALVTSAQQPYVDRALGGLGLAGVFDLLVTADDVRMGKPDPEGYLRACERLRVAPADAVGFEDSRAGVAAIRAAGMRCVAIAGSSDPAALEDADLVVASLEDLPWPPFARPV
jgi:beta-phosphoglucomutase-like phosphatase (HAD superfamily)